MTVSEKINFNPGSATRSIAMQSADLLALIEPIVGSFTKRAAA
jgi:hypothetical protein